MIAGRDPRRHTPVLPIARPVEIAAQPPGNRAEGCGRRLDHALFECPEPRVGLGFEPGRRALAADEVPDLMQRDEVGDLAADRRYRDLQLSAPPADRSPTR